MTTLQYIGLGLGLLVILTRLPGIIWPQAFSSTVQKFLGMSPAVLRVIGIVLWAVAFYILLILSRTFTTHQLVMLVLAVLFVLGGGFIVFTPRIYQSFARNIVDTMNDAFIRIACTVAVVFGVWIVYLSLTVT